MPSGLTATTADHLILDVGILYNNGTPIGLTQGGADFDPGRTDRQVEFDGSRAPVAEMEYPVDYKSVIKASFIEISTGLLLLLEPGGSVSAGVTTPISCGTRYTSGNYITNLALVGTRGNGSLVTITFPTARFVKWALDSKDKKETVVKCEIMAYLSLTQAAISTDGCPYTITEA